MRILITAGGTGGHIMPAVAIAQSIKDVRPETEILFVGTGRGMEERIAHQCGLDFIPIAAMGIKGKSLLKIAQAFAVNLRAFIKALKIIHGYRPAWVIGTGGYITGMVVLAGYVLGSRCAIQEQNSIPGLTNRILSRIAKKVFLAFPDSGNIFPHSRTHLTGNPIRSQITQTKERKSGDHLLILGGSLGASSINHACVEALKILREEGILPKLIHQTGARDLSRVKKSYDEIGIKATVYDFIDDIAPIYTQARLAVCRCGGLTLAELSRLSVPAIMIPYPHAADDHQMHNAQYVASMGGGWIIPDSHLTPERLALEIKTRLHDGPGLMKASSNMSTLRIGDGSARIAQEILGV